MSIFWHLQHETMIIRLAQLEEKIASQREKLKQLSPYRPEARTALRILEVREQSFQRAKVYKSFIESKLAFGFPAGFASAPTVPHFVHALFGPNDGSAVLE
jgi:hypothetical protein